MAQLINQRLRIGGRVHGRIFPRRQQPSNRTAQHNPDSQTDKKVEHDNRMPAARIRARHPAPFHRALMCRSFVGMRAVLTWTIIFWLSTSIVRAADPQPVADSWLTNGGVFPEKLANAALRSNLFTSLRAEAVAGTLQIKCEPGETVSEL